MQQFKNGDVLEKKFENSGAPILTVLSAAKDEFLAGAFEVATLGDMIFESNRSPLTRAISQDIFRLSFKQIFESFVHVGTFEAYLTVFAKIFGDDVEVTFTVPAAGKLNILIEATGVELSDFVSRTIADNEFVYDQIVDESGNHIVFQTIVGFQTQYELEQMLFEMVPAGIYTVITLTLGGA